MKLRLPERFDLIVGDTLELFYKGMVDAIESDVYDFEFTYSENENLGKSYARKYVYTPKESEVGEHTLSITVRGADGAAVDTATVCMAVHPLPKSPSEERVVLCIGDSLTSDGIWVEEFHRRLTGEGGTPEGYGLSNLTFIGSKRTENGVSYEGYGGWTFTSYICANARNDFRYIYGEFSDKTEAEDQHSLYRDEAGKTWKLEAITAERIKLIAVPADGGVSFPASGTLTWVSGGLHHGDIVYEREEPAESNPFWDGKKGQNDFAAYVRRHRVDKIDEVILLLGWNSTGASEEAYKANARTLIDGLLSEFPDCHITLMGIQVPSRDGFGENYGIVWKYHEKLQFVFSLQQWYIDLTHEEAYEGKLDYVNLSAQFDTVNNMPSRHFPVNLRNSDVTEQRGTNGVHPALGGYYQIADAITRYFVSRLG